MSLDVVVEAEVVTADEDLSLAEELSLKELAHEANRCHSEAERAVVRAVEYARQSGLMLNEAKSRCRHGEWLPWLAENFTGSQQTASRYMTVAANYSRVSNLTPGTSLRGALEAISAAKKPDKPADPDDLDMSGKESGTDQKPAEKPERKEQSKGRNGPEPPKDITELLEPSNYQKLTILTKGIDDNLSKIMALTKLSEEDIRMLLFDLGNIKNTVTIIEERYS